MTEDFEGNPSAYHPWLKSNLWRIAIPLILVAIIFSMRPKPVPFSNLGIQASPYVWPIGCDERIYEDLDKISEACISESYYIGDGKRYGWPQAIFGGTRYYRVGNDAANIACNVYASNDCKITQLVKHSFLTGDIL